MNRAADWDRPGHGPDHPLMFAHDLARFKEHLRQVWHGPDGSGVVAASYLHLLGRLAKVDGSPAQIAQAVAEAIAIYDDGQEQARRYFTSASEPGQEPS